MIDFILDNIAFFAVLAYAAIIFVAKIISGKNSEEDESEPLPRRGLPPRPGPAARRAAPQAHRRIASAPKPRAQYVPRPRVEPACEVPQAAAESSRLDEIHAREEIAQDLTISSLAEDTPPAEEAPQKSEAAQAAPRGEFDGIVDGQSALRRAFVAAEILGKPKALRGEARDFI